MFVKLTDAQAEFMHAILTALKDGQVIDIARMTKEQKKLLEGSHTNFAITLGVEN